MVTGQDVLEGDSMGYGYLSEKGSGLYRLVGSTEPA